MKDRHAVILEGYGCYPTLVLVSAALSGRFLQVIRNNMKIILLAIPVVSILSFLSCSSPTKNPKSRVSKQEQKIINSYRSEVNIGRNMAGRLLQYYGVVDNTPLINYVNEVGNYVASYGDFPDRKYMFQVLDSDEVNAFACPGGYILVTAGALKLAKNEAELAAILGHEVAHVGLKHMYNTINAMGDKDIQKAARELSKSKKKDPVKEVRKRPEATESSEIVSLAVRYLGGGSAGLNFVRAASAGMSFMLTKGLDEKYELEADRVGIKYAINAGYAPFAMPAFLSRLNKNRRSLNISTLDKTHPSPMKRIKSMVGTLNKMDAKKVAGAYGTSRYLSYKTKLPKRKVKPKVKNTK